MLLEKFLTISINHAEAADSSNISNGLKTVLQPKDAGTGDITSVVATVIDYLIWIAGILAFFYLVYSGILYITAAGNPDQAKKGQQGLINAVIGIIVIVLAYVILHAIANTARTATPGTPAS
jgi:hypothetical protein